MQFPQEEACDNTALHPVIFASKSFTSAELCYNNIEREALAILHELEMFHHYCFAHKVSMIIDQRPQVAIFKKDETALSQRLERIL